MGINKVVYRHVRIEMAKQKLVIREMAQRMNMPVDTLSRKLSGFASFKLEEAIKFRNVCFPGCTMEYLFIELYEINK